MTSSKIPQDIADIIEKLDTNDQAKIKTYINGFLGDDDDAEMKDNAETESKNETEEDPPFIEEINDDDDEGDNKEEEEENTEAEFPPLYESGEDFDKAGDCKAKASEYKSDGKWDDALEQYTQAVLAAEPSPLLYANRAYALLKLDRPKAAERDCTEALKINPDSAKALRIRGKARLALEKYDEARHDLSESQQIDFDEGTVEDLKKVSDICMDLERKEASVRIEKEEKLRKRASEIKKAQEEAKKEAEEEAARSAAGGMGGMPGGMGGMPGGMPGAGGAGGMPGGANMAMMQELMSDPEIAEAMKNPKVVAAFSSMMGNPMELMSNPGKVQEMMADPEVGPVLQKIMGKMGGAMGAGGMPGGMGAGMPGGGMGGSGGGGGDDDGIPDLDDLPDLE